MASTSNNSSAAKVMKKSTTLKEVTCDFNYKWEYDFLCFQRDKKVVCLLCRDWVLVMNSSMLSQHYTKRARTSFQIISTEKVNNYYANNRVLIRT